MFDDESTIELYSSENRKIKQFWPDWKIESQIGRGAYGTVYKAVKHEHNLKDYSAIKIISIPQDVEYDQLRAEFPNEETFSKYLSHVVDGYIKEIELMRTLQGSENVVLIHDYKCLEKTDKLGWDIYLRMELLTPLNEYMKTNTLDEAEIRRIGIDVCKALEKCEKHSIIHRDIKPENMFRSSDGVYKIGDFGIAKSVSAMGTASLSHKGTESYMAPEVFFSSNYDSRADIYSLGIVLYKLLNNNCYPFLDSKTQYDPNTRERAMRSRINGEKLPPPQNASSVMSKIILKAAEHDVQKRYASALEFRKALEQLDAMLPVRPSPFKWWMFACGLLVVVCIALIVIFAPKIFSGRAGDTETIEPSLIQTEESNADTESDTSSEQTDVVISGISVHYSPSKTNYYVGDTLDTSGLVLKLTYSDNSVEHITSGFTCNPTTFSSSGPTVVTVSYGGKSTIFYVSVKDAILSSIFVKDSPTKTSYQIGEMLNTSGLKLNAKYSDGSTKTISSGFTCIPTSWTSGGTKTIIVSYGGKTTSFKISVENKEIVLNSITIKTLPTKTSYYAGEALNTSGLTLNAKYSDGSTKTITSGFTCSPTSFTSVGTKTITVTYSGKTATFNVTVSEKPVTLSSIAVLTKPTKTSYYVGEMLDTNGLMLVAYYSDGSTKIISSGFSCNPIGLASAGTKTITVTYGGKTTMFSVSVEPEPVLASGTCGGNLTWTLKDGVLTISGKGALTDKNLSSFTQYSNNIKKIVISSGITSIGTNVTFGSCENITELVLSETVALIGSNAFIWEHYLPKISVVANNPYYTSIDGVLFTKDKKTMVRYPAGKKGDTYEVPSGVVTITEHAFAGSKLKKDCVFEYGHGN